MMGSQSYIYFCVNPGTLIVGVWALWIFDESQMKAASRILFNGQIRGLVKDLSLIRNNFMSIIG